MQAQIAADAGDHTYLAFENSEFGNSISPRDKTDSWWAGAVGCSRLKYLNKRMEDVIRAYFQMAHRFWPQFIIN